MSLLRGLNIAAIFTLLNLSSLDASDNIAVNTYYSKNIELVVNDITLNNLPMNPLIYNNYLLVPSREVFVPLGAYVEYKDSEKKVYILYKDKLLTLQVDNKIATVGNEVVELAIPPKIVANKLMIPLRSVSENLGLEVKWDSKVSAAYVNEKTTGSDVEVLSAEVGVSGTEPLTEVKSSENTQVNTIIDIKIPNENEKNRFIIEFENPIEALEKGFIQDNRVILDFLGTTYTVNNVYNVLNNKAVEEIRIGKEFSDDIIKTRVVFDLSELTDYSTTISEDKKYVFIDFSVSEEENNHNTISSHDYSNEVSFSNNRLVISKGGSNLNLSDIIEFDDYNNKKYSFVFPSSFNLKYNNSKLEVNDSKIDYFGFSTVNGLPAVTVHEKRILSPIVSEDTENIYITMVSPKERYKKIVIIDPGHGGTDPGAQKYGINEKDINFAIANKVNEMFKDVKDIKIYVTRTEDIFITRPDRIAFANELGDLFISIHANANTSTVPKGIETYYYNNEIVNKLGLTSLKFAEIAQKNMVNATNAVDRKVKTEPFDVIKFTNIPAILLEVGFVSNEAESKLLTSNDYQYKLAESIKKTIYDTFEIYTPQR